MALNQPNHNLSSVWWFCRRRRFFSVPFPSIWLQCKWTCFQICFNDNIIWRIPMSGLLFFFLLWYGDSRFLFSLHLQNLDTLNTENYQLASLKCRMPEKSALKTHFKSFRCRCCCCCLIYHMKTYRCRTSNTLMQIFHTHGHTAMVTENLPKRYSKEWDRENSRDEASGKASFFFLFSWLCTLKWECVYRYRDREREWSARMRHEPPSLKTRLFNVPEHIWQCIWIDRCIRERKRIVACTTNSANQPNDYTPENYIFIFSDIFIHSTNADVAEAASTMLRQSSTQEKERNMVSLSETRSERMRNYDSFIYEFECRQNGLIDKYMSKCWLLRLCCEQGAIKILSKCISIEILEHEDISLWMLAFATCICRIKNLSGIIDH